MYDTAKGMWHREDDLQAGGFASFQGELYCVDAGNNNIITMLGSGEPYEEAVDWEAETGDLCLNTPDRKYISRLAVRMQVEPGATVDIYAQYDLDGEWLHLAHVMGMSLRGIAVPLRARRCDHIRLRFVGRGYARIYSISKTLEGGSDQK